MHGEGFNPFAGASLSFAAGQSLVAGCGLEVGFLSWVVG
jgi:hypothetical protein